MTKEEIIQGFNECFKHDLDMPSTRPSDFTREGWMQGAQWAERKLFSLRKKEMSEKNRAVYVPEYATSIIENEQCDIDSVREALAQNFLVQILQDMDMSEVTTEDDRRKHIRRFCAAVRIGPSYK